MLTKHRTLRHLLQVSTLALMTAVVGVAGAQDQPRQKTRVAAQPAKRPVAKSPKKSSKPSGKSQRDQRDDAMFGGEDTAPRAPRVEVENVPAAETSDWETDDALFDDPESFDDLPTSSPPEATEAEHRGSTRPVAPAALPRAAAPAAPVAGSWRVTPVTSPDVLAWDGGDVPPGYEPGTRARRGLLIGGAVTFGVTWLAAAGYGVHLANEREAGAWRDGSDTPDEAVLFIPVAGPWIALGNLDLERGPAAALIVDGVAQAGGLAMLAAGIFAKETVLVKSDTAEVQLAPTVGPTGSGVTLSGSF